MTEQLTELCKDLPGYLGGHLSLSASALAVGLAVSLPLGVLASRRPKLSELALGMAGVVQTVPSLALLALMVPLLGGMIGFAPAFLALVLYSVLPILANTVIGLRGVDPVLTEAARGLGMSDRQMLLRVQLPLAAPVLIAGVRTATVLVVGTATLATPVGEATLGNYIFQGLETRDHLSTVFGCVAAAVLAVVLDQLIRLLEAAARRRSRALACVGA
ncbi:MAG TPA: ABC transporter permease, partial [Gemmataceae bacterium]|nr:ABC transporter permease [Gemmataceae bacterium]